MTTPAIRPLIAGNWKMNGSRELTRTLIQDLKKELVDRPSLDADLLVCPPAPYLLLAAEMLSGSRIALGAQDCHALPPGAHTGDISAGMLIDCGCSFVILGHSERRADHGETSETVMEKAKAAIGAGLRAIVCVGETLAQRESGETLKVVESQLEGSVPADADAENLVIAYEPVWAIGTGKTPTNTDIETVHRHIRKLLTSWFSDGHQIRILYGGSVKGANAAEILAVPEVNGALVGGASLKTTEFWAIATARG